MTKRTLMLLIVVAGLGVATWVAASTAVTGERPDCPGKIVCPQTGELICRDRCPLNQVKSAASSDDIPACCRPPKS